MVKSSISITILALTGLVASACSETVSPELDCPPSSPGCEGYGPDSDGAPSAVDLDRDDDGVEDRRDDFPDDPRCAIEDASNCGACGQRCGPDESCVMGVCSGPSAPRPDADEGEEPEARPAGPCDAHQLAEAPWTAVSPPVTWNTHADKVPFNIHMTYSDDPATTLALQWATALADVTAYTPRVWIAPLSEVEGSGDEALMPFSSAGVYEGSGERYRESLLGEELGETDWVTWTVHLTCLSPNTTYAYRVGTWGEVDAASGSFVDPDLSPMGTFTTGPVRGSREPFEVVLAGDSRGGTDKIRAHMEHYVSLPSVLWGFNGDMSNGGTQPEWSDWMDAMAPLLETRPLMPVQGNHEVFANVYYAQFALPLMEGLDDDLLEHAWAFTYGNVHFIGLDSNSEEMVSRQVPWLEGHLASVQEDPDIDWVFVMMHHASYSACHTHGSTPRLQNHWVPLFEDYGVDIVFSGHDHNYERTFPIRDDQVVAADEGVVYIVAGAFGAPPYTNGSDWWTDVSVHGEVGNYVRVHIDGTSLELKAYSMDGAQLLDTFTLQK